jgi:hypothetical protein
MYEVDNALHPPRGRSTRVHMGFSFKVALPGFLLAVACSSGSGPSSGSGSGGTGGVGVEVALDVLDPCSSETGVSFLESAAYLHLAIVRGSCPSDEELAGGVVESDPRLVKTIVAEGSSLPQSVSLPEETFGFVVLSKDFACGVIGFGCTEADTQTIRTVLIAVRAWTRPAGQACTPLSGSGCPLESSCTKGRCI